MDVVHDDLLFRSAERWIVGRPRAAWIAPGSGGGVDGIDTVADDGTSKSSTGGQKGRGAAKSVGNQGIPAPRRPRPGNHDVSSVGLALAGGSRRAMEVLLSGQTVQSCPWLTQDFLPSFLGGLLMR